MTADSAEGAHPLRPTDPRQLGSCRLLGRIGEGGMGTVFLAELPSGRRVAVKMIRADFADNVEFRRRFRGEVNRARQVPPFCTAEVLDADPDHDPPYLVVEYIDGPSLASVVTEQGPLTPGNLHGLAIGVATALTAIHGAGVIHRDLKPSNVLLPPGSPKVIDFGISRALEGAGNGTRTDQVIGTVDYLAPERFEPAAKVPTTPAADVFAWGAVVAFAGTGRAPFAADSPQVTAARILTQQPDLTGLTGLMRSLVQQALAKDPRDRPTARELLDRLLTGASQPSVELTDALAHQPALLAAAEQAQAATDRQPIPETGFGDPVRNGPSIVSGGRVDQRRAREPETKSTTRLADPRAAEVGNQQVAGAEAPTRRRRLAVITVALVVLAGAAVGLRFLAEPLSPRQSEQTSPGASTVTPSGTTTSAGATAPPTGSPSAPVLVRDPLTVPYYWRPRTDERNGATCAFDGAFIVTKRDDGPYRCQGPQERFTDFRVNIDVTLRSPGSCAGIWFRFTDETGGYALRICQSGCYLVTHGVDNSSSVTPAGTFPFPGAGTSDVGEPIRVGIVADGESLRFFRDGVELGGARDSAPVPGRLVLGIFGSSDQAAAGPPPYRVSFRDIEITR